MGRAQGMIHRQDAAMGERPGTALVEAVAAAKVTAVEVGMRNRGLL